MGSKKGFLCSYTALSAVIIVAYLGSQWKFVNAQIECGTIDGFLAQHDHRAQSPWTATLYFQSTKCDFRPAGNGHGVILGPTAVLMKGNFMWSTDGFGGIRMDSYSPNHFMVVVGLKSKSPFLPDQHTQFLKVSHIQPHSLSYDAYTEYDYAIVHLKNPIQYTSFVRPICVDVLPEGVFDRSNSSLFNEHLKITGFRTGSGNFKSALHPDKDNFGLLSSEFCTSKLQKDLTRSNASPLLIKADSPCGVSTNAVEGALDVRSIVGNNGENGYSKSIAHLNKLLNFTYLETVKGHRPLPNICFHNGAAVVTLYQGKWHLAGIVTESLGLSCESNLYFVSFVASRNSLNWILQHLRNGLTSFVCSTGQTINLGGSCNGNGDCLDGSDEDSKMCECSPSCSSSSSCILQPMCKHCPPSDSLQVLKNTYKFSNAVTPLKRHCAPVFPPLGTTVYCKAPGVKSRIPCDHKHFPGTQAIFSCQHFDIQTPSTYCVITCKEDGDWTDELNSFQCNHMNNKINEEEVLISERRNLSASSSAAFTSTTTQPPITPRPISQIIGEGEKSTGISFEEKYRDKNGTSLCPPIKVRDGVQVSCWTTSSSKQVPCEKAMYPGSKAEFRCSRYYRPLLSTASVIKQCQPGGEWSLSNRNFDCRLDCGIPKSDFIGHIVNGRETDGAKWPWHGLIFIDIGNHNYTYICGSTLVSKRVLITAAHCVTDRQGNAKDPSLFKAVLAATSNIYHKNILDDDLQIFDVSKIVVHSLFNVANFEADIAILQLSRQIEVSDYVRPSCYPSHTELGAHTELKHLSPGSVGTVVGFGYDESGKPSKTLREAGLPVVSYRDCFEISRIQHSTTQYCAGYTNGTSVCNGDSGSGQFFVEEFPIKRMYLQGIVSHGNRDESSRLCDHNQYSVFTKVGAYKNWISETGYELDEEF